MKKKKNLYKSDAKSSTVRSCNFNMSHIFTLLLFLPPKKSPRSVNQVMIVSNILKGSFHSSFCCIKAF